ncbi:unnamed protein product, partial [Scytosiphon promiscuus]
QDCIRYQECRESRDAREGGKEDSHLEGIEVLYTEARDMSAARDVTSGVGHVEGPAAGTRFIVKTGTGPADSRCPEAVIVAINQAFDMGQWYTATKE